MNTDAYEAGIVESYEAMLRRREDEIDILKSELNATRKVSDGWYNQNQSLKKLVTELCNALERYRSSLTPYDLLLIERARDATK